MGTMTHPARRVAAFATALAMAAVPGPGFAQGAPGPALATAAGDPPARVGRLARLTGTVSYHLAGADRWEPAVLNLPVTTGGAFWTEPAARADIGLAGTRVVLDQSTELDVAQLDDHVFSTTLLQGATYWHQQALLSGDRAEVQTPRGLVAIAKIGRYEVVAGDTTHPTTVTVVEGEADVTGPNVAVHVGPNQTATIIGDGTAAPFQASLGPAVRDPFLTAMLAEERPVRKPAVAPPAGVALMTGGEALEEYGDWAATPDYGPIWYPPAEQGFVPYRDGHWAYVQPWGWTWVDNAAWGFAPSHYGRWLEVNNRWGWIPGERQEPGYGGYPVYAPAVVSFLAGAAIGATVGALASRSVGWVPLGPREPYYPPYRVSNTYIRNVNVTHVTNVSTINNFNNYGRPGPTAPLVNRAAVTLAPASAMVGSQTIAGLSRPLPAGVMPTELRGRAPINPTLATAGVTPGIARQLGLPPSAGPQGGRPAAPGPAFGPGGQFRPGPAGVPGGAPPGGPGAMPPGAPEAGGPGRPSAAGMLGGAAVGAAAGVAAGALLRPGAVRPGPGGAPGAASGAGPGFPGQGAPGLPGLREPGSVGGFRPNGGAPGPALPQRAGVPGVPGVNPAEPRGPGFGQPGSGQPGGVLRPGQAMPGVIGPERAPGQPGGVQPGLAQPGTIPGGAPRPGSALPSVTEPRGAVPGQPGFGPGARPQPGPPPAAGAGPRPEVQPMRPMAPQAPGPAPFAPRQAEPQRAPRAMSPEPRFAPPQAPQPRVMAPAPQMAPQMAPPMAPRVAQPPPPQMQRPMAPPPQARPEMQRPAPPPPQARPAPPPPQMHSAPPPQARPAPPPQRGRDPREPR